MRDLREMLAVRGVRKAPAYDDESEQDRRGVKGGGGRSHGMGMKPPPATKARKGGVEATRLPAAKKARKGDAAAAGPAAAAAAEGGVEATGPPAAKKARKGDVAAAGPAAAAEDAAGGAPAADAGGFPDEDDVFGEADLGWLDDSFDGMGFGFGGFDDFDDPDGQPSTRLPAPEACGATGLAHGSFDDVDDDPVGAFGCIDLEEPLPPPLQPPWALGCMYAWLLDEDFRLAVVQFWDSDDEEVLGGVMEAGLVDQCLHEDDIHLCEGVYKRVADAARQTAAEGGSVREQAPKICAELRKGGGGEGG